MGEELKIEVKYGIILYCPCGGTADAADSKSADRKIVWVQLPPRAHKNGLNRPVFFMQILLLSEKIKTLPVGLLKYLMASVNQKKFWKKP